MVKKYDSKKTIDTILNVSSKLFLEKGYDKTSMRAIVEECGFSKGAIYHHFKSKEEIFNAVTERQASQTKNIIEEWLQSMADLSGKEKLENILEQTFANEDIHSLDKVMVAHIKSDEFIVSYMRSCVNIDSALIEEIIREGNKDGSITVEHPRECAEVFLLLLNIWCDPIIFSCDSQKLKNRLVFLQYLLKTIGIDVLSDKLLQHIYTLLEKLYMT